MPRPDFKPPHRPTPGSFEDLPTMSLEQWIETLRRSDRAFYNMIALEVWSIAKTMDNLLPGFWNRFMNNRRLALKQYIQHRQLQHPSAEE